MLVNLEKSEIAVLIIVFISFITGWYFYPSFPEQMASHWNAQGNVDGYTAKLPGLFLFPLMMFACALLFIAVPRIDPLKANIFQFRKYYNGLIIILALFLFLIYIQTLLWNLGTEISPNITLPVGIGFLFFYTGILCDNAKRNWFVGIRTPWTLSSEEVWNKTHKMGSKLFKAAGIIAFFGIIFPVYTVYLVLIPALTSVCWLFVYSYLEYNAETKKKG